MSACDSDGAVTSLETRKSIDSAEKQKNINDSPALVWDDTGMEVQQVAEKRGREEITSAEEVDDGEFITVSKGAKRLNRSISKNGNLGEKSTQQNNDELQEVCVTSKQALPKQIGLAKLLAEENITNILSIKYKNPFKVLIKLKFKQDLIKLQKSKKLIEMDCRCQMFYENTLTYGIVKQVDLIISEKELSETLTCEQEIISIKRLKYLANDGKWEDSETIRVCFKSPSLPQYIYGYGCRFKVLPYTFPVSQCSRCWKFGHLSRQCTRKKIICPKCSGAHENCDTSVFKCANCQGDHMALDRKCLLFRKEKRIRKIMSEEGVTYRNALEKVLKENSKKEEFINDMYDNNYSQFPDIGSSSKYKDAVLSKNSLIQVEEEKNDEGDDNRNLATITNKYQNKRKKKKKKARVDKNNEVSFASESENENVSLEEDAEEKNKSRHVGFELTRLFRKIKEVFLTESSWEEKVATMVRFLLEELKKVLINLVGDNSWLNNLIQKLFYGLC